MAIFVNALNGNDANDGLSKDTPKITFAAGLTALKAQAADANGNKNLYLYGEGKDGTNYPVLSPLSWSNTDNVTGTVTIRNYGTGTPYIVGGVPLTSFTATTVPGVYSTPRAVRPRHVWSGARKEMYRCELGHNNTFYRIYQWEQATKSVLISSSLIPGAAATDPDLEMVILIGWSKSYLRVASITDLGNGLARVTFKSPEADVEFAKGLEFSPGLGAPFGYGPYHQDLEQHFWWESGKAFCNVRGAWQADGVDLTIALPFGVSSVEQMEDEGIWVSETPTAFNISGASSAAPVRNLRFDGIGFKYFDWVVPNTQGHIGYQGALYLYNNAGTLTFGLMPAVVNAYYTENLAFTNCRFEDIGNVPIQLFGHKGFVFENNLVANVGCSGFHANADAGPDSPTDYIDINKLATTFRAENNIFVDIAQTYTGSGIFLGNTQSSLLKRNTLKRGADDAITLGFGARALPTWAVDNAVCYNEIDEFLQEVTDGGAIYTNSNQQGYILTGNPVVHEPKLKIYCNYITNIRRTPFDLLGGKSACVYLDLGATGVGVMHNHFKDCDLAFNENCVKDNRFEKNKLENVTEVRNTFFSGYNVYDPHTALFTLFQAPLENPASETSNNKFYGLKDWAGRGFFLVQRFANPAATVNADGTFNSTSYFASNDNLQPVTTDQVGASAAMKKKYAEYLTSRYAT